MRTQSVQFKYFMKRAHSEMALQDDSIPLASVLHSKRNPPADSLLSVMNTIKTSLLEVVMAAGAVLPHHGLSPEICGDSKVPPLRTER